MAQDREVVLDDLKKDVGTKIFAILGRESNRAALSRMADDVNHQTHEPINEVFPCPWLASKAAVEQFSIEFRESHDRVPY
jgi:hypothetical protein